MLRLHIDKHLAAFDLSVDLTLNRRITGLYGPSGSGKTTLLDCVAGLVTPERGATAESATSSRMGRSSST